MFFKQNKGFTLIELLVVIAVIGLLVSAISVSISKIKIRGRDVNRVSDIKSIQEGLAMYNNNYQAYPIYDGYITGSDSMSISLVNDGAMQMVPTDPINSESYQYYYQSAQGSTYLIQYYLETDSIKGKSQGLNTAIP